MADEDTPLLDTLAVMTAASLENCNLEPRELMLVRIAALASAGAPPASYLVNAGTAIDLGITLDDVQRRHRPHRVRRQQRRAGAGLRDRRPGRRAGGGGRLTHPVGAGSGRVTPSGMLPPEPPPLAHPPVRWHRDPPPPYR